MEALVPGLFPPVRMSEVVKGSARAQGRCPVSFYRLLWNRSLFQRNSWLQMKSVDSTGVLQWKEEGYGGIDFSLWAWSRNGRVPVLCMFGSFVLTSVFFLLSQLRGGEQN